MPNVPIQVDFEIAYDKEMTAVIRSGSEFAWPIHGHSLHLKPGSLQSNTHYWYRFHCQGYSTEPARARTLPKLDDDQSVMRLGHVSCQNYTQGEFKALEDMVNFNLDMVVHVGDYIYETHFPGQVRESLTGYDEPITLAEYRNTYAMYKADPRLQKAHAHCPWLVTWDDHEVENGYHGNTPSPGDATTTTPEEFVQRKTDAYQAWWEHSPVRLPAPQNGDLVVHREFEFGSLAKFYLLDTRQYRTPNPCEHVDFFGPRCEASFADETTMLGFDQEAWLEQELLASNTQWQFIGSPNVLHQWRFGPTNCNFQANNPEKLATVGIDATNCDTLQVDLFLQEMWDGYPKARERLTDAIKNSTNHAFILSGGIHSGWVSTIKTDFEDDESDVVGIEYVGPATTSKPQLDQFADNIVAKNEHVKWSANDGVGWTFHVISAQRVLTMFRTTTFPAVEDSVMERVSGWTVSSDNPSVPRRWS